MPDTTRRKVDSDSPTWSLRADTPQRDSSKSKERPPSHVKIIKNPFSTETVGKKKRPCPTTPEPPTKFLKTAHTELGHTRIVRPSTPPDKIIPQYGIFPRHTHPSTPPTLVPSLRGSSIPSANTTPEKGSHLSNNVWKKKPNSHFKPSIFRAYVESHNLDRDETKDLLHTWLNETFEDEITNSPPNKVKTDTPNNSPQLDDTSSGTSVSNSEAWSEPSSDDDENDVLHIDFQQHLPWAVKDLYRYFRQWQKTYACRNRGQQQESHQGGSSGLTNTTTSYSLITNGKSSKGPRRKRTGDEDEDQNRPAKHRKLNGSSENQDTRLLACPFAKKNPLQHRKCFKYMLQEIARLKQHLLRVHQVPIHCARCSKIFDTVESRDHHSRQPECIVQPPRTFDGISESQRQQLGKRISSKKSREENWYLIYQILFPDATPPGSPYIEDMCVSEEVLAIREFATQAGPARIAQFFDAHLPAILRSSRQQIEAFTQAAVQEVFDMILDNWDNYQLDQSSVESTPHRSTPGSNHDSGYSTNEPPSGSSDSSGTTSRSFNDTPLPLPMFELQTYTQALSQVAAPGGIDEWDFENVVGNFGGVLPDNLYNLEN